MTSVIYETRGRAREFNELAINLFTGCGHRCVYCYGSDVMHIDRKKFELEPCSRVTPHDLRRSAADWVNKHPGEKRSVLLCFVTDPYQLIEAETGLTRTAIEVLHFYGLRVTVLTKGGKRATRDLDILGPTDEFATTLTCIDDDKSLKWEPGAALPKERMDSLLEAHIRGIPTWVSLEPVISLKDVETLIARTMPWVGHYKIGTMNYHSHGKTINWHDFGWRIKRFLDSLGVRYYLKKDLKLAMGVSDKETVDTWRR